MLKEEFERIANIEVSYEDYKNIIEPMYMSTDVDKFEFVKMLDLKRFALKTRKQLINVVKKLCAEQNSHLCHYRDYELDERIQKTIEEIRERFDPNACITKNCKFSCFYYDTLLINDERISLL